MVKKPSTRHSKSSREPVTIDLKASESKKSDPTKTAAPFEGSPKGSVSSFDEAQNTDLSGHPTRSPARHAGETVTQETAAGAESKATASVRGPNASSAKAPAPEAVKAEPSKAGKVPENDQAAAPAKASPVKSAPASDSRVKSAVSPPPSATETGKTAATVTPSPATKSSSAPSSSELPRSTGASSASVPPASARPADSSRNKGAGFGSLLLAGIVGGAIVLGGSWLLDSLRGVEEPLVAAGGASSADVESLRAELAELRSAQEKTAGSGDSSAQIEELRSQITELQQGGGETGADGDIQALTERLDQLTAQVEQGGATGGASENALQPLNQRLQALEQSLQANEQADGDSQQRFTQLQSEIEALGQKVEDRSNDPRLALAITASALKAAIDRGQPFQTEFDAYAAAAGETSEAENLRDMAATGVPTRAEIAAELPDAISAMLSAARPAPENGVVSRLWSSATSLVEVRPVGADAVGDDAGAVLARLEAAVETGDYAKASSEFDRLPEASKAAGQNFMSRVRARQTADDLVGKAIAEALKA